MATARLAGVEMFKLRKRPMTWILVGVLAVTIVIVYILLWAVTEALAESAGKGAFGLADGESDIERLRKALFLRQAVPFGLQITQALGTFLAVILASGAVGSEYGWDTIRPYLTAAPSRREFLAGQLTAIAVLVVAGTLVGMTTAIAASAVISALGGDSDYSFVDAGYLGESAMSYGRTVLAMAPYMMMAVFFSIWGRSTMAGIGASLGILFLEAIITSLMQLAGGLAADLANAFPGTNVDTLMLENSLEVRLRFQQDSPIDVPMLDPALAALVLAGYAVAFAAAAFVLFERRDVRA